MSLKGAAGLQQYIQEILYIYGTSLYLVAGIWLILLL